MKLKAEIDGASYEVAIEREGDLVFARVGDRQYELEVSQPEPGVYLIKHDNKVYEAVITDPREAGVPIHVRVIGSEFDVTLTDPKRLRGAIDTQAHSDGLAHIKTEMPGKVVRVLSSAGDVVQKGSGIIVVEAMKMQNELRSPKAGVVREVRAVEGATVNAGDILAVVE